MPQRWTYAEDTGDVTPPGDNLTEPTLDPDIPAPMEPNLE
jgi:hypothetical protein